MPLNAFGIIGVAVAMFVLARSRDGQVGLSGMPRNVRYWPLADIGVCAAHVCFRRQSGHRTSRAAHQHIAGPRSALSVVSPQHQANATR